MYKPAFKRLLLSQSILATVLASPYSIANQDAIEEVLVTGSKIRQNPLEQSAPVNTLTAEDLQRSGIISVADVLQRLPNSGGALNTKFNSSGNFGFPPDGGGIGAGAAQVDLRHLGSKRVLVLVDGVRWVSGSSASGVSSATDLNTIPSSIIERVEVLEDGASAIYGSDAIAGVVNIITKKNYEGFELSMYSGEFDEGDGETQEYNLSWGVKDDDTNIFFSLSFADQGEIFASDRKIASTPVPNIGNCGAGCSSGTPQGRFIFRDPNTGQNVDVTLNNGFDGLNNVPVYDPTNPNNGGDFNAFDTQDRFNFSPYNLVMAPVKRWGLFTKINHSLTDSISLNLKALYNNRESRNQAAPEPLFIGPEGGSGNLMDTISVDVTNPYNPLGFTLDANTNPYFIGRRPLEGGPRIFRQDVDTFYVSAGLEGSFEFSERTYFWDATIAKSKNSATQIKTGGYNSANIKLALGPLSACQAVPGCVPLNIFGGQGVNGGGTITQDMLDWIRFVQKDESEQELFDITFNFSGELFDLPAGPVGFALGYEYREQDGFFQPDAVVVAGESAGVPASPARGDYDVDEYFIEVNVPLVAELPGAKIVSLSAASRTSDYSTFGSDTTTKLGLNWRVMDDLLLRFSVAEGLRAPGIGELYGADARFDQTFNDPCSDLNNISNPTLVSNCIALGVPADGSYSQTNPQISVTTGGNEELEPETSDSVMWGIVYSPSWVDRIDWIGGLDVELNHYDIEIEDAIQAPDAEFQINVCTATLDPIACQGISRTGAGTINGFSNQLINIGGIDTSGYDLTISYTSPDTEYGLFSVKWSTSHLDEYIVSTRIASGITKDVREGTELGDPETGYPEWKSTVNFDWIYDNWSASWTLRYIHDIEESCEPVVAEYGLCSNPSVADADPNLPDDKLSTNELDATVYNDLQVTWRPEIQHGALAVTAGINNIFDEDPPACYSCAINGFDATLYDVPGQFLYMRLSYQLD